MPGLGGGCGVAGLGVLTGEIGPRLVDEVVDLAGCREERVRLLPARAVVYFVLGMCLLSGEDSVGPPGYRSVMRSLTHGVRHLSGLGVPSRSALCKARRRLGSKPFELLFDLLRGPLGTAGASAFGLRVVAWDGTGIDVPGTAGNAAAFGGPAGGGPQLRLLALIECGTHALLDAAFDGFARASEQVLARRLLHALRPGMLLLADRAFPGYQLWGLAAATGAHLAWRVRSSAVLTPVRYLPDGSYLSVLPTPHDARQGWKLRARGRPQAGHRVRVIEYAVTVTAAGGGARTEAFRLVTTLLDWEQAPAAELAALYQRRWEAETGYGELKTRLRGAGFILRSRAPELACQEMWAFLAVFQGTGRHRVPGRRAGRHRPRPDLLHRHHPDRPRPRPHPARPAHPPRPGPRPPARHHRHARRPAPPAPGPALRPPEETTPEQQLPDQEQRRAQETRQSHLPHPHHSQDATTPTALSQRHCVLAQ
jgi:hypothetical protein